MVNFTFAKFHCYQQTQSIILDHAVEVKISNYVILTSLPYTYLLFLQIFNTADKAMHTYFKNPSRKLQFKYDR
jgi:hypothetical protein